MSKNSQKVINWRKRTKARIVESMGGKCNVCGYNKCDGALVLHHLNPKEKEFGLGAIRANCISWARIVIELRKCVLLCANCHGEFHADLIKLPKKMVQFNEEYADYKAKQKKEDVKPCPICGEMIYGGSTTCSSACAGRLQYTIKWDDNILKHMFQDGDSFRSMGRKFGATGVAAKKRLIKIGMIPG